MCTTYKLHVPHMLHVRVRARSLSVAAAQLSHAALVAHGVLLQLWMLASYAAGCYQ